jgi:N-methylhydantoinase A
VPVIDLAEVSAGGGSIAWIDPGGALRVGPASAGAEPGPVCYGQGGLRPTVTDADLVLGYLNPVALLGGALPVHLARARAAIEAHIARPLGMEVMEAASGIVDVVNAGMAAALRIVSVERGHDPREFALVAFGGAGPVHAARLAQELDIPQVIVPPIPGGLSALGLVASDVRRDYARTFYAPLASARLDEMARAFQGMEAEARQMLAQAGVPEDRWEISRAADCRYGRQAYELTVPVGAGAVTPAVAARLASDFHERHRTTYGHASPDEPVQVVNLRVAAVGKVAALDLRRAGTPAAASRISTAASPISTAQAGPGPTGVAPAVQARHAYFKETGLVPCPVLARDAIAAGAGGPGPAIIEAADTTIVVPPGWRWHADDRGFAILERSDD